MKSNARGSRAARTEIAALLCYRCGSHVPDGSSSCGACGQPLAAATARHATGTFSRRKLKGTKIEGAPYAQGSLIAGRYLVKDVIGAGPVGFVFRAQDKEIEVEVAIKVVSSKLVQTTDERKAFSREIRLGRKLSHNHLVRVYEDGEDLDRPYFTMQYLDGLPLRRIVDLRREKGQFFAVREVEPIVTQIAAALESAHKVGPHTDVRPENVIILPDLLKLTDFGLGLAIPRQPFAAALRARRAEGYLAPEYLLGQDVDGRTDVYSLGVLLGEMLAGVLPDGAVPSLKKANPDVPERVEALYQRAVNPNALARFSRAADLAAELAEIAASTPPPRTAVRRPVVPAPPAVSPRAEARAAPPPPSPPAPKARPTASPPPPPLEALGRGNGAEATERPGPLFTPLPPPVPAEAFEHAPEPRPTPATGEAASALIAPTPIRVAVPRPVPRPPAKSMAWMAALIVAGVGAGAGAGLFILDVLERPPEGREPTAMAPPASPPGPDEVGPARASAPDPVAAPPPPSPQGPTQVSPSGAPPAVVPPMSHESAVAADLDPAKRAEEDRLDADRRREEEAARAQAAAEKRRRTEEEQRRVEEARRAENEKRRAEVKRAEAERAATAPIRRPVEPERRPVKELPPAVAAAPSEPEGSPEEAPVASPQGQNELGPTRAPARASGRCPPGMKIIAAGEFKMGSSRDDPMMGFDERPLEVTETDTYCIDVYEFPNQKGANPRINVSFAQAEALCKGKGKRLCTEEEWERVCKGTSGASRYPYGATFDSDACNTRDAEDADRSLAEAGRFGRCRSGFGVADLSGNVAEWTATRFSAEVTERAVKGGSFARPDYDTRCATRKPQSPDTREPTLGLRCCADVE